MGCAKLSRLWVAALLATPMALMGCGGKTALTVGPPPPDGGPMDAGMDAGSDAGPPDGGSLEVLCPRADQYTSPRRPISFTASVTSPSPVVSTGWTMRSAPPASRAENAPTAGLSTTLTPDVEGDYVLEFFALDAEDRTGACEVTVHSVVGPPVAICPEGPLEVGAGLPLEVLGDAYDDFGVVVFQWTVERTPPGASVRIDPTDGPVTVFVSDTPGAHELQLLVVDEDMAIDTCVVSIRVTAPPVAECPGETIRTPTRQRVRIRAMATDDTGIRSARWEVVSRPAGSTAEPSPADDPDTRFTPDKQGEYLLRLTVVDLDGLSASCDVLVVGLPSPPDAVCPATVDTPPLTEVELRGDAIDDGMIVDYEWRLISSPMGSAAAPPSPVHGQRTRFTPDLAGEYRIRLTVRDDDGMTATCELLVRAVASEGLRIEVFWNTDGTDMDTHLLNPSATSWFNDADCYYANCIGGLEWGAPGPDDNPSLDIDDTDGLGPENINVERPQPGRYRVGVHSYRGGAGGTRVTVRIYCGGSTTMPRRTFTATLRGPDTGIGRNDMWRVADVDITGAVGCTIIDLATGGAPNIVASSVAQMTR